MFRVVSFAGVLCLSTITVAAAQSPAPTASTSFPRVIRITGTLPTVGAPSPIQTISFAIYADETGGTPLWQETQTVIVDSTGAYNALLGATVPDGLPLEIFTTNDARWLSIHLEGATAPDSPRVLIASVAYALRAADADTLGGKPASAYVLADSSTNAPPPAGTTATTKAGTTSNTRTTTSTTKAGTNTSVSSFTMGTPGHLGLFTDPTDLGDSVVVQSGARIGIGTSSPFDYLHIAFNDSFGAFTGLALQNLSNSANAASGTLFYDQNGVLGQFQGFNNTSHVYAINNIAKNGSNQFDGSIHFLIGSTPRLSVISNGNVGIGTATPLSALDVRGTLEVTNDQLGAPLSVTSSYAGNTLTDPTMAPVVGSFGSSTAPGNVVGAAGTRGVLALGGMGGLGTGAGVMGGEGGIGLHAIGGNGGNSGSAQGGFGGPGIVAVGGDAAGGFGASFGGHGANITGGGGGAQGGVGILVNGGPGVGGAPGGVGAIISAGTGGTTDSAIFIGSVSVTGNLSVSGTVSKGGGSFRIDHPLDPAHQYLSHSFVESPDMMNVYNGIAVLDATGVAWVELPEWFEALNRDFRYQLTALGVPAPGLFIASEVQKNHFEIAGGQPGARVSWQITGIRHDAYANAHRIPVEEAKPETEQGTYLHPELYGQPPDRRPVDVRVPDLRGELGQSQRQ